MAKIRPTEVEFTPKTGKTSLKQVLLYTVLRLTYNITQSTQLT